MIALDMPFLLLPFRPGSDPVGSKSFIRNFFRLQYEGGWSQNRRVFEQELKLMDPLVRLAKTICDCFHRLLGMIGSCQHYEVVLEQTSGWCGHMGDV